MASIASSCLAIILLHVNLHSSDATEVKPVGEYEIFDEPVKHFQDITSSKTSNRAYSYSGGKLKLNYLCLLLITAALHKTGTTHKMETIITMRTAQFMIYLLVAILNH